MLIKHLSLETIFSAPFTMAIPAMRIIGKDRVPELRNLNVYEVEYAIIRVCPMKI
jgi:hypothetical protein